MKNLKYFVFSLIYFSSVFGIDDNTRLPTPDTLQQKIQFAMAKNKDAVIEATLGNGKYPIWMVILKPELSFQHVKKSIRITI